MICYTKYFIKQLFSSTNILQRGFISQFWMYVFPPNVSLVLKLVMELINLMGQKYSY